MNSPEVNPELSIEESQRLAAALASPARPMTLETILRGPQNTEDGMVFGPEQAVVKLNQQSLSEAAISRVSRASDAELSAGLSPEVATMAIEYVAQIGVLNVANRDQAVKMGRDDFTRAA